MAAFLIIAVVGCLTILRSPSFEKGGQKSSASLKSISDASEDLSKTNKGSQSHSHLPSRKIPKNCVVERTLENSDFNSSNLTVRLNQCQVLQTSSDEISDQIRAFFPEWKHASNNNTLLLKKDSNSSWISKWWRSHQSIQFPNNPVPCGELVNARYVSYTMGSQIFTDLNVMMKSDNIFYRYLDVNNSAYLTPLGLSHHEKDGLAMKRLRSCFLAARERNQNAIHCAFLPTSDCVLSKDVQIQKPPNYSITGPHSTREEALCGNVEQEQHCINKVLKRPVPVSPKLQGALYPDVSTMALFLFGRIMEMAAPLHNSVQEAMVETLKEIHFPCVAVHIRRGDKMRDCGDGKLASCAFHKNWTEYSNAAIGFLEQMETPQGGSLFVMTDDPDFLKDKTVDDTNINVVGLSGSTPTALHESDGVLDLVLLMASLEVGSMCEAVVGNSESEVSELLVLMNCLRRGICPSVHSMNGRPLQAFEGVIADGRASTVRGT